MMWEHAHMYVMDSVYSQADFYSFIVDTSVTAFFVIKLG